MMKVKRRLCTECKHPGDDHSVYRPICLVKGCDCTEARLASRRRPNKFLGGFYV